MRAAFALVGILLLSAAGCGAERPAAGRPARGGAGRRTAPRAEQPAAERVRTRRLSVDIEQMALGDLCALLGRLSGVRIRIEDSPGRPESSRVSVAMEDRPVAAILDWACRQAGVLYAAEGDEIWIARDLPRVALGACATLGYSLEPVTAPPGRPAVAVELRTGRVWDPVRDDVGELLGRRDDREEDRRRRRREEAAREEFLRIVREALAPVLAGCPEARLGEIRGKLVATLPPRGHRRLEELLSAFGRGDPPPLPRVPAPVELPRGARPLEIDTADFAEACRACARAWSLPVGYDARQALAWAPRRLRLSGELAPEAALESLLRQSGWAEHRREPEGIWLEAVPQGIPAPFSSEHPWDRCLVRVWEIPEAAAEKGFSGLLDKVRARLSPAPTRGHGRLLTAHVGMRLLVAVQPPEVLAQIPGILEDLGALPARRDDGNGSDDESFR